MYICLDCGALFNNLIESIETHGLDNPPYEKRYICPKCGGAAIREALKCDLCDMYIPFDDNFIKLDNGAYICESCYVNDTYENEL